MAEVLVIGSGGREDAIRQAMQDSDEVSRVEVYSNVQEGLDAFSRVEKPFVIIGPEAPLIAGMADDLRGDGYTVFGASKAAAQYEASKSKTVKLALAADVVHPETFIAAGYRMPEMARFYVEENDPSGYVIKADGLFGGKGVELPKSRDEARSVVNRMVIGEYDGAGSEIINFAKRKFGPEVSAMVVVGGGKNDFEILPLSQDHKKLYDGDQGPNTGGMGAYAPVPKKIVSPDQYEKIYAKAYALLEGIERQGVRYDRAVMYMGLMMSGDLTEDESDLLEINVRFGDPESQVIFPLLKRAGIDAYRLLRSAAEGRLEVPDIDFAELSYSALTVCLAAAGYPSKPRKGDVIFGAARHYENVSFQLAGVKVNEAGRPVTDGGRVLYVTGLGENIDEAANVAYAAIGQNAIHFEGNQYRKDIGWQARTPKSFTLED